MEEIITFFANCKMFYIATIEDGKPRVRPFGNLMQIENDLYINTGRNKRFYAQIQQNPYVELCTFDKGTWYRIEAAVKENDNPKIKNIIMENDPFVQKHYADKVSELVALRLTKVKAYRCNFNNSECVYESKE